MLLFCAYAHGHLRAGQSRENPIPKLMEMLQDDDRAVRAEAVAALLMLGPAAIDDPLIGERTSRNVNVRREVVAVMGQTKDPRLRHPLIAGDQSLSRNASLLEQPPTDWEKTAPQPRQKQIHKLRSGDASSKADAPIPLRKAGSSAWRLYSMLVAIINCHPIARVRDSMVVFGTITAIGCTGLTLLFNACGKRLCPHSLPDTCALDLFGQPDAHIIQIKGQII